MNTINEVKTLKITFGDGTETTLQKWFTNQFDYFKNIIEDLGEEMVDDNGNEYKYLELEFTEGGMGSELGTMLTKPILAFLKRLAYHIEFLGGDDELDDVTEKKSNNHSGWNKPDSYQTKMLMKYIKQDEWDELFKIYFVTDYLGNSMICHAITDTILNHLSDAKCINIAKLQSKFGITSQYTLSQQTDIIKKFDWRE